MTKKSVEEMTTDECREFLGRSHWRRAVCLMYQAIANAKACVADSEKRAHLLDAAGYADTVISSLYFMRGYSKDRCVKISQDVSVELWSVEKDAINALKKRYELNKIDEFTDTGYRMFR